MKGSVQKHSGMGNKKTNQGTTLPGSVRFGWDVAAVQVQ